MNYQFIIPIFLAFLLQANTAKAQACNLAYTHTMLGDTVAFFEAYHPQNYVIDSLEWFMVHVPTATFEYYYGNTFDYIFSQWGDYEVCVDADIYDVNNVFVCRTQYCEIITISNSNGMPCDYSIEALPVVNTNDSYVFNLLENNGSATPDIIEWYLDGGGGSIGNGASITYTFPANGTYDVCLDYEISGSNCMGPICETVIINTPNYPCTIDFAWTMNNDSLGVFEGYYPNANSNTTIDSVEWTFTHLNTGTADGGVGNPFTYIFPLSGDYQVCVYGNIYDNMNNFICRTDTCNTISINLPNGTACDYEIETVPFNNSNYQFDFNFIPIGNAAMPNIVEWFIDGQTGTIATGLSINHTFASAGTYEMCADYELSGTTCFGTICTQVIVTDPNMPCVVDYEYFVDPNNVGSFEIDQAAGYFYTNTEWIITGNGIQEIILGNPMTYQFSNGSYQICLITNIQDASGQDLCTADECKTITIGNTANCEAYFEYFPSDDTALPYEVEFYNSSNTYTNAYWEFGDGNTSLTTDSVFIHEYQTTGYYQVCLTVWDSISGCQSSYCELIDLFVPPNCAYEIGLTVNGSVVEGDFIAGNSDMPNIIEWYIFAVNTTIGNGQNFVYTIPNAGTYEICADYELSGSNCAGTICEVVTITDPNCANTDCVFPGDADYDQIANNFDLLAIGLEFGKTGPTRNNATNDWYGQPATDWNSLQDNGINTKHADCNGDGTIDFADVDVINLNFDRTHNGVAPTNFTAGPEIYVDFDFSTVVINPNDPTTYKIQANILAGTATTPAQSVHGMAFTLHYPSTLVNAATLAYDNASWLGTETETINMVKNYENEGELYLAFSRTNQQGANGYGHIATIEFTISSNVANSGITEIPFNIELTDAKVVNEEGDLLAYGLVNNSTTIFVDETTGITPVDPFTFGLYPSPTATILYVELAEAPSKMEATLRNSLGQRVQHIELKEQLTAISVDNLPSGLYFLTLQGKEGKVTKKILVK